MAVNPDLTPRWTVSLRGLLNDGCGTPTLPPMGAPVVAPDGSILFAIYTEFS
jgi:hypothetical protein